MRARKDVLKGIPFRINLGRPGTKLYRKNYMKVYRKAESMTTDELIKWLIGEGFIDKETRMFLI